MKTTFLLCLSLTVVAVARAQDAADQPVDSQPETVGYTTPVVYEAPVVYNAPVAYYAPVYYLASAAATAVSTATERYCPAPSTVIHITGGRGTYTYSSCANESESTVIHIGARQPRSYNYFDYSYNRFFRRR